LSNIFLENDFAPIQGKRHGLLSRPSRSVGTLKGQCGTHRANWQASSPPAVRCRRSKISAGEKLVCAFGLSGKFVEVSNAAQAQENIRHQFANVFGN
jgi:hypothetical protein